MPSEIFLAEWISARLENSKSRCGWSRDGRSSRDVAIGVCQSLNCSAKHLHCCFRLDFTGVP
jgi:hypothetical protein